MTRPVKEAASASAKGKPRPVGIAAWKVRKAILAIPATDLSSAGKVLLSVVADHAGYGQSTCWATNESLAFESGLRERQMRRLLSGRTDSKTDLISAGWLTSTWKTTWKGRDAHRDLALGPKTLEWIERILPRLDTKFRARPSMDWEGHLAHPREGHLAHPREGHLAHQNSPSLEHSHMEQSSSSSSTPPPPAENPTTTTCASLPKNKSGGSKQKAKPLSDDEGLWMVCRVACQCPHLPGMAAKLRAKRDLETRIGHDWRGLARQVARLEELVAARDIKFGNIKNPASYVVGMLEKLRSTKLPAGKLDALDATVERLLASASSPGPRKPPASQPRPDPAAAIADLERELLELEAKVASASNRTAKGIAQLALNKAREELAALETAGRVAP
jgi:hypothetical protein